MRNLKPTLALASLTVAATPAWAQFPDKPLTLAVPFAAGGPGDKIARDVADAPCGSRWARP